MQCPNHPHTSSPEERGTRVKESRVKGSGVRITGVKE